VYVESVAASALGELIATAVAATAGTSWRRIKSSPEAKTVKRAVERALLAAFLDARRDREAADDGWVVEVAKIWERAFTEKVLLGLIACLANAYEDPLDFAFLASKALAESGCEVVELERTFWVEQFLCVLPRLVFEELRTAALSSPPSGRATLVTIFTPIARKVLVPGFRRPAALCDHEGVPSGTASRETIRYSVRLTVPRRGGWRAWGTVRAGFDHALVDPADPAIIVAGIASEHRRRADYIRVTVALAVAAADGLTIAWDAFTDAAGDDPTGWEVTAAAAEVQPGLRNRS
jgi:hypothetical protein